MTAGIVHTLLLEI